MNNLLEATARIIIEENFDGVLICNFSHILGGFHIQRVLMHENNTRIINLALIRGYSDSISVIHSYVALSQDIWVSNPNWPEEFIACIQQLINWQDDSRDAII